MTTVSSENPHAGQGSVLLDIGDDVGALVITMPAGTVGLEVEVRPLGAAASHHHDHDHRPGHEHEHGHEHLVHVAVVARPVADGSVPSLVYPELGAGSYDVFEKGHPDEVVLTLEVTGGQVTVADWPT